MTNEELETIKSRLEHARAMLLTLRKGSDCSSAIGYISSADYDVASSLAIIDNVQKRAVSFGRGPDCYNCDCKTKCERYAQR